MATPTPTPFGWETPVPGLTPAIPTPTPLPADFQGCHRWRYALRWERPSRLAVLKNVLGNSVTTYSDYKAPGNGLATDWPDPLTNSVNPNAWNYQTVPGTVGTWKHDCGTGGAPACQGAKAWPDRDSEGEFAGIHYSQGTWDYPDPNSNDLSSVYDPLRPPVFHPASDTRGSQIWETLSMLPLTPHPYGNTDVNDVIIPGQFDGWAWTLNYGYGQAPNYDIVYGPDPGPPLAVMDETPLRPCPTCPGPDSIPGQTGRPQALTALFTLGGAVIGPGVGGAHQPTWTTNLPRNVVGKTKDLVNWGLATYNSDGITPTYTEVIKVKSDDSGDVTAIEAAMQLKLNGGLTVTGGTPTKGAIEFADTNLTSTWNADPKKACPRAYGVILCTDGQSNIGNTGSTANKVWDSSTTDCVSDTDGNAFQNFPPGAAEAMYLDAHQAGGGDAIIRARTFAIGISKDISRCELNRTAYRGRTDASALNGDAGFLLVDPNNPPVKSTDVPDDRLPHINPSPETASGTNESGPGLPNGGINRFGPDQSPQDNRNYAFFANDAAALTDAFTQIVASTGRGDFTTSAPVAGGSVSKGNTVILPSTKYPKWEGHVRALEIDPTDPTKIVEAWDAGNVLTNPSQPWHPTPATRKLYTWDPATGDLISIVATNAAALNALCGSPCATTPITAAVIDFIRGNDGKLTDTKRGWLLGPPINSTPAIVGTPRLYQQGSVQTHKAFEATYVNRRPLAWVGADDGFMHAFDFEDGSEVIGLLSPSLIASQLVLYNNFLVKNAQTGQRVETDQHTWGVANSLRFADVWFPACAPSGCYKTVGFLTTGPGGDLVAAIDITHPYPGRTSGPTPLPAADPNFNASKPVEILWTRRSLATTGDPLDYPGLNGSWSVPAVAPNTFTTSRMTFGAGINPTSLFDGQQNANIFVVDPVDGKLKSTTIITPLALPNPIVGHQTFADSVFFQTSASGFHADNVANLSLQADTNGRVNAIWGDWNSPTSKVLIDLNAKAGGAQPIYYSPAANGIGALGCQVYALGSGSLYETSPAVSGWNVNRTGNPPAGSGFPDTLPVFVPSLFIATNPFKISDTANFAATPLGKGAMSSFIKQIIIGGESAGIPLSSAPCPGLGCDPTFVAGSHEHLGIHTQVTSSPLLVMNFSTGKHEALFSVYDPDWGCHGFSYVVVVEFTITGCAAPEIGVITVSPAGEGASSGTVGTDEGSESAQSGLGSAEAKLFHVDLGKAAKPGSPNFVPLWWKEQK